jgi:hypothetical protein
MFDRMLAYVRNAGGWIVSEPYQRRVEIEAMEGSTLADDLRGLGFELQNIGDRPKLLPRTEIRQTSPAGARVLYDVVAPSIVQVFELTLPEINVSAFD